MPDRLPSLVVLAGFWVAPAVAGWMAAGFVRRPLLHPRARMICGALALFVLGYAGAWFLFNLGRMPPYIPGALPDPTVATPQAVGWLAVVTGALVLPGSALACLLAYRLRPRAAT